MPYDVDRISELFVKYLAEKITAKEEVELDAFIAASPQNRFMFDTLTSKEGLKASLKEYSRDIHQEEGWKKIIVELDELPVKPVRRLFWVRFAAAAVILLLCAGIGVCLFFFSKTANQDLIYNATITKPAITDIAPGQDKATLILADGSVIVLDQQNGKLTQQGNTVINKQGGKLFYKEVSSTAPAPRRDQSPIAYNILSTKKGEQYQLHLPDHSKVWLNAASTIKFPVAFPGNERKVELTGEGYFEIATDKTKPFRVVVNPNDKASEQTVEVLGTHFNIQAYKEEPAIQTTLLEGSIKLTSQATFGNSKLLSPGQQALFSNVLSNQNDIQVINNANTDLAIAWKNGLTSFKSADIPTVMRQVARWYNVDVVYEGTIPDRQFSGYVSRQAKVSEILDMLKYIGIHFKIEAGKIVVMP